MIIGDRTHARGSHGTFSVFSSLQGVGMSKGREKIEAAIKRTVRQRCGFGCVVCGKPFYEYDHIEEYSKVKEHEASNLTLLCPEHHAEKTKGLRSVAQVKAADANPFNKRNRLSGPYVLAYEGTVSKVSLGSYRFLQSLGPTHREPLVINGEPVVKVRTEDGNLLISAKFCDAAGSVILKIEDNELRYDTSVWDVEFVAHRLVVRKAHREIIAKLTFSPPDEITVERGCFSHDGLMLKVTPRELLLDTKHGRTLMSEISVLDIPYGRGIALTDAGHAPETKPAAINLRL
ncbi:HNH endonuclease signature motif containing protein [Streptomyces flaveolus]|uniref:HNH endonuclease signature motif containing protein n=1 Tax=Streptomyces flaveolus TaxID=67297 RepID=A0ABV1V9G7_9ACTN